MVASKIEPFVNALLQWDKRRFRGISNVKPKTRERINACRRSRNSLLLVDFTKG